MSKTMELAEQAIGGKFLNILNKVQGKQRALVPAHRRNLSARQDGDR